MTNRANNISILLRRGESSDIEQRWTEAGAEAEAAGAAEAAAPVAPVSVAAADAHEPATRGAEAGGGVGGSGVTNLIVMMVSCM